MSLLKLIFIFSLFWACFRRYSGEPYYFSLQLRNVSDFFYHPAGESPAVRHHCRPVAYGIISEWRMIQRQSLDIKQR